MEKGLKVHGRPEHEGGIDFTENAYAAFPRRADTWIPPTRKEQIIYLDLEHATPEEIGKAYQKLDEALKKLAGS